MARKTTPAKTDDATEPTTPATPRRTKATTPAEVTTPATDTKETTMPEPTTPAEAPEATPATVEMDIPGYGKVQVPTEVVTEAAKKVAPAKRSTRPELPSEAWKIDPKYRRYSEAVTYVADLKDTEVQAGLGLEPVVLAPGLVLEWAACCETHTEMTAHRSKGAAVYAAADSMLWCRGCKANVAAYAERQRALMTKVATEAATEK